MIYIPAIIASIENDDDRSFMESLYRSHRAMVYRLARKYAPSPNDIDDVVGETFLALIKKIQFLRTIPDNEVLAYIAGTTKRVAADYIRKKTRIMKREVTDDNIETASHTDPDQVVDAALIRAANISELKESISRLNPGDQDVLTMKYFMEMSDKEIAAHMGLTVDSVRPKLARAKKRLYAILKTIEDGEDSK